MDLIQYYGLKEEEVLEWGQQHYPMFLNNRNLIAQLYLLKVKNIKVDPALLEGVKGVPVKVAELKPETWSTLEVAIGVKVRENQYLGCPNCLRRVDENNECSQCGRVTPKTFIWEDYVIGDDTGDIVASFPPKVTAAGGYQIGDIVRLRGILRNDGSFIVAKVESKTSPPKEESQPVASQPEVPVQAAPSPAPTPPKKVPGALEKESDMVKRVLTVFSEVQLEDLKRWHSSRNMVTPLEELLKHIGAKIKNGKVSL